MFLDLNHAAAATAATTPWWGTALGAGIGALGAGVVSAIVAYINNRANRRQLDKQLAVQQLMLERQLEAQRDQMTKQMDAQLKIAEVNNEATHLRDREDQQGELRKWQLETRREAYVNFVVSVERVRDTIGAVGRLLAGTWPVASPLLEADLNALQDLEREIISLYEEAFQRAQVVRLTGPNAVANHAKSLGETLTDYVTFSSDRFRAARRTEQSETLRDWQQTVRDMNGRLQEFIDAAYAVVNITSTPPPSSVPTSRSGNESSAMT
ncbi:hypothetical protein ACIGBH_16410 [Streptomyces sp. NPDC085929]|uniref:hypothetical protein n=1 Tax=Streptomyces sp. NPDC085929 TaxID=3365739 RepID=UPI0037D1ABBB